MKVLKVIHGYPMCCNTGSKVYGQTLCSGSSEGCEVHLCKRGGRLYPASGFRPRVEHDEDDPRITVHVVNTLTLCTRWPFVQASRGTRGVSPP